MPEYRLHILQKPRPAGPEIRGVGRYWQVVKIEMFDNPILLFLGRVSQGRAFGGAFQLTGLLVVVSNGWCRIHGLWDALAELAK